MTFAKQFLSIKTLAALNRLQAVDLLDRKSYEKIQLNKLKRVLEYAYQHFDFYRNKMRQANFIPSKLRAFEEIQQIPCLTKDEYRSLIKSFEEKYPSKILNMSLDQTSGSTGTPLNIYRTWHEKAMNIARFMRPFMINGLGLSDKTLGIVAPSRVTNNDSLIQKLGLMRRDTVANDLATEELVKYYQQVEPDAMYSNLSNIVLMAIFAKENNISLSHPKFYYSVAETLEEGKQVLLKEVFGENLLNHYGTHELGTLAFQTLPHNDFMTMAHDTHYFEVINEAGQYSDSGELVITDLDRMSIPLIRYRIGDEVETDIYNKTRVLTKLKGRSDDFVKLLDGSFRSFNLFSANFYRHPEIIQYRIIQEDLNKLTIEMVLDNNADSGFICDSLAHGIKKSYGQDFDINFDLLPVINIEENGKIARFVRKI